MPSNGGTKRDLAERVRIRKGDGCWIVEELVWHEPANSNPGDWRATLVAACLNEPDAEAIARKHLEVMRWRAEKRPSTGGVLANGKSSRPCAKRPTRSGSRTTCAAAATTPNGSAGKPEAVYLARMGIDGKWSVQRRARGQRHTLTIAAQLSET